MNSQNRKVRILFVQQELKTWLSARMWGYNMHIGFEEGFLANDVEVTTILSPWFPRAKELISGKTFDQVWINDVTHMFEPQTWREFRLREADLEWLAGLAPVRLGLVIESLQYSAREYAESPFLRNALNILRRTIGFLTHVMAPDEKDFELIRSLRDIPLSWLVFPVPERCVAPEIPPPTQRKPFFHGTPYAERGRWLSTPPLNQFLEHRLTSDNSTEFPKLFNQAHRDLCIGAIGRGQSLHALHNNYLTLIREIRRRAFEMYLRDLQEACAVVSLPSHGKVYTGRVYEGIATGRPVIAMKLKKSPRLASLFEDGKEILLYPFDKPMALVDHIRNILDNPDFGRDIAVRAREKMLRFHTTEKRVKQILDWIATGEQPDFTTTADDTASPPPNRPHPALAHASPPPAALLAAFETEFQRQLSLLGSLRYRLFLAKRALFEFLADVRQWIIKRLRLPH